MVAPIVSVLGPKDGSIEEVRFTSAPGRQVAKKQQKRMIARAV